MIGYYIDHRHGSGQCSRAVEIARELSEPVIGLSSLRRPDDWPGPWYRLPADGHALPVDPTANGVFQWAPLDHDGHRSRMARLAEHLEDEIDVMVTDSAPEVALFSRVLGVRTVVVATRSHSPHQLHRTAYDAASMIIAPWARRHGEPHWPRSWTDKTEFTGSISRFDTALHTAGDHRVLPAGSPTTRGHHAASSAPGRVHPRGSSKTAPPTVLVLWSGPGQAPTEGQLAAARAACPQWTWVLRTPQEPTPDLWRELLAADVIVARCGAGLVAEVAAAGRPAVIVGQGREFGESRAMLAALDDADVCETLDRWPAATQWPQLLDRAVRRNGTGWRGWHAGDGALRAARAIERLEAVAAPSKGSDVTELDLR